MQDILANAILWDLISIKETIYKDFLVNEKGWDMIHLFSKSLSLFFSTKKFKQRRI